MAKAAESKDKTLKQKMAQATAGSGVNLNPTPRAVPPPPPEDERVPDITELIADEEDRDIVQMLIIQKVDVARQIKPLEAIVDNCNTRIKKFLSEYGITKAVSSGIGISYTATERKTINRNKLIAAGVDEATIDECTDVTTSSMLKLTPPRS